MPSRVMHGKINYPRNNEGEGRVKYRPVYIENRKDSMAVDG